jgi:glycine cleavage system T protein (aminomethyltransferase)
MASSLLSLNGCVLTRQQLRLNRADSCAMVIDSPVKQSALLDLYRGRGASLIEREGWLLPAHFGDPIAEYHAVRNHIGILDLCQRNCLRLTGHDRISLLKDRVSNDLTALTPGQGLHTAFLDLNGKILADARIFCSANFLLVDLPEARKQVVLRNLQPHPGSSDVAITDLFADCTMLSVQGPHANRLMAELAPASGPSSLDLTHLQVVIAGGNVTLIVVTHGAELGYDLIIPLSVLPDVVSRIEEAGKRWSLSWVGLEAQEMLRIEAGIPLYGVDITEENSLLETGQDRWINFQPRFAGLVLQSKQTVKSGAKITMANARSVRLRAVTSHRIPIRPSLSVMYEGIVRSNGSA